jgi:type VI protein secretion system component VasK
MAERKKKDGLRAGDGSVVIGGSVNGSNIVVGNNNVVSNQRINLSSSFQTINRFIDQNPHLQPSQKKDAQEELKEIKTELEQPKPDENFLVRRFRNLERMAPDIVDVAFETLKNPVTGVATVIQKIAKRMADEVGT